MSINHAAPDQALAALAMVDNVLAGVSLPRRAHLNLNAATELLGRVLREHAQLAEDNNRLRLERDDLTEALNSAYAPRRKAAAKG